MFFVMNKYRSKKNWWFASGLFVKEMTFVKEMILIQDGRALIGA